MKLKKKQNLRQKRIWRIRKKVIGTAERPRLCVSFSNKHIYAQVINDVIGVTLVASTTLSNDLKDEKAACNLEGAKILGSAIATKAKAAGIESVVFDRHGKRYHGRVKAFADAAREAGLQF
jgi:large subunit ribosomal protein L18